LSLDSGLDEKKSEGTGGSPRPHRRGGYIQIQFQNDAKDKP